jgi:hypothetical protein
MGIIENILEEWAYRVDNGMPNPKDKNHLRELAVILDELELGSIKNELIENLLNETSEDDKYEFIGYGRYKEKGKKDDPDAPTFRKDDVTKKYIMLGQDKDEPTDKTQTPNEEPKVDGGEDSTGDGGEDSTGDGGEEPQQPDPAQMFAKGVDVSYDDRLDTERELQAQLAKGGKPKNEKPKQTKRKKKNKELDQSKDTKKEFNEGKFSEDVITDTSFNSNPKVKKTQNQIDLNTLSSYFTDENGNCNFPKKYLKVLYRLLNTKDGNGLTISDFTDTSGVGTLASSTGELLGMMAITIKDNDKANEFFKMVVDHVNSNGKESVIDAGWVKSAQKVRNTLYKRYDRTFGKGNWELKQMSWDVESEVEALGLENYKENKGFSTDIYAKVKVNGKSILDEISLKKELNANLLNATSGRVEDIMVRGSANEEDLKQYDELNVKINALAGLKDKYSTEERKQLVQQKDLLIKKYNAEVPDEVKVSYTQKKQREIHEEFIANGEVEIKQFFDKFCSSDSEYKKNTATLIKKQLNQKENYINEVTKKLDSVCKELKEGVSYETAIKKLEAAKYQKLNLSVMAAIASETPNSQAAKSYKAVVENSHNHSKAVRDFLLTNKSARKGLFASIREAFPLKALFEGEENMILGDVSADKQVLQDVFGVETFEELEQKLTIRDTPPPPSIVYSVIGQEDIPIAEIKSRPDGIGYGGVWKLEMVVHSEFGKRLKESNEKLNK